MADKEYEIKEYQANLEALVTARTQQLKMALELIDELVIALEPLRPELAQKVVERLQKGLINKNV
jgi:methionyl-tRNA synthetase